MAEPRTAATPRKEAVFASGAVAVTCALTLTETGPFLANINPRCGCLTGISIGPSIAATHGTEFAGAELWSSLADARCVAPVLGKTVICLIAVSVGIALLLYYAGSLTDYVYPFRGSNARVAVGVAITTTDWIEFKCAEHWFFLTCSRGVTALLREAVIGLVAVSVGIAFALNRAGSLTNYVHSSRSSNAWVSVGPAIAATDGIKFAGAECWFRLTGSRCIAPFLGKTVIGLIAVSVGIALLFYYAGSLADHVDSGSGSQAWVPVGPTVAATDRIEFAGAELGFFLAGSGCVAALFGEAVVSIAAVGIAVAPAICHAGPFPDHVDSCGRGGTGIAISVSITPADRSELKGAENGPLPAGSWGVAAFLGETVFGIAAVGIAGALGLLTGSKIFHACVGFRSCAGIGVGLPIASTHWIKNFVTPPTGARVHAGLEDSVNLRGVGLAGGDCYCRAVLQAFSV